MVKRIEEIDALRGFALFGIIMTHMFEGYLASMTPPQYVGFNLLFPIDSVSQVIIKYLFVGKFYAIFSMLFGLSFYLIIDQKRGSSSGKFAWRLILLFLIGFIHHIHYRGDFLTVYAVFGMALILFRKVPDRVILVLGLFLAFNGPMIITKGLALLPTTEVQVTPKENIASNITEKKIIRNNPLAQSNAYFELILNGEYLQLIKSNATIGFINKINYLKFSGRIWVIPGLFLLGLWIGRKKWHETLNQLPLLSITRWTALIGIPLVLLSYYLTLPGSASLSQYLAFVSLQAANIFMPLLYIGLLLILFNREFTKTAVRRLIPVGKMGLTTYVMQSAFGVLIYYGYGLNLLLKLSGTAALGLGLLFFGFQIVFSRWWFKRYKFGPIEWIWRCATNRKWQANKKENEPLNAANE
jgi:uncharacterized protein